MSTSLSSLANNPPDGLYSDKCADCKYDFDYMLIRDDQLIFRCIECKKIIKWISIMI